MYKLNMIIILINILYASIILYSFFISTKKILRLIIYQYMSVLNMPLLLLEFLNS